MANEFVKVFKGLDKAINQGTTRALNRALSTTRTQLVKNLAEDTSLKSGLIKDRILAIKATANKISCQLAIAIKVGVSLAEFSPLQKIVNVLHRGHTHTTRHLGVSVKVNGTREIVPGGWLWTAPSGKQLVLARKGVAQHPVVTLRSNAFKEAATKRTDETKRALVDNFNDQVVDQIDYAVQSKFDSDR